VAHKFHTLTAGVLGARARDRVLSTVDRLEAEGDVTRLVALLRPAAPGRRGACVAARGAR
jgi:hypothetical protein